MNAYRCLQHLSFLAWHLEKILLQQSLEVLSDHDHGKQAGHLLWLQ